MKEWRLEAVLVHIWKCKSFSFKFLTTALSIFTVDLVCSIAGETTHFYSQCLACKIVISSHKILVKRYSVRSRSYPEQVSHLTILKYLDILV